MPVVVAATITTTTAASVAVIVVAAVAAAVAAAFAFAFAVAFALFFTEIAVVRFTPSTVYFGFCSRVIGQIRLRRFNFSFELPRSRVQFNKLDALVISIVASLPVHLGALCSLSNKSCFSR